MRPSKLKVGICQMTSVDNVEVNLSVILDLIKRAVALGSRIILFPENALYMRICEGQRIEGLAISDSSFTEIQNLVSREGVYVHLGSVPLRTSDGLFNSSILISPDGKIENSYQKIHLFDIDLSGQKAIRESDIFKGGLGPRVFEVDGWRFGQSICYDLRFSELYSAYSKLEVDAILIPAAFLVETGKWHWETLIRARAIESQTYVLAAAQAGTHNGKSGCTRDTYGHSMGVDPWGRVMVEGASTGSGVYTVDLDRDILELVRRQIPMKNHRRL